MRHLLVSISVLSLLFPTSFDSLGSLSSLSFLCFVTACQKTRHARSSRQTHVCANCCTGADILPSRFLERQSPTSSFPCTHPLPWSHHIYWSVGLNEETAHVSPKLISVSPHDSVTRAHHLVFRLISTEHSCSHLSTSCAPAATGPSSPFPERRRGSRVCGATRVSLVRMYGLPVSERRKDGASMKSFPLDGGY